MQLDIDWTFPVRVRFDGASVYMHNILETFGIFIAFRYYLLRRRRSGDSISTESRIWIVIAATFGAVLGSRVLGALENVPQWRLVGNTWAYLWGNKTLVGGLLGGLFSVELVKRCIGEHQRSGDLFVFPLLLGMIIGRIGCFTMGVYEETYGLPSDLPWAMQLGDGVPRHPVALYEILFLLVFGAFLSRLRRSASLDFGALFKIFMIGYLGFRFLLDFIKPGWRFLFGLGSIQLACFGGLLYYSPYILRPRMLQPTPENTNAD